MGRVPAEHEPARAAAPQRQRIRTARAAAFGALTCVTLPARTPCPWYSR